MKKLTLILLLLIPSLLFAQEWQEARIMQGVVGGGGCSNITCTGYLICQDLEATGYNNSESWTETIGTNGIVDEDSAEQILASCQSLKIYAGDSGQLSNTLSPTFTAQDTLYTYFKFRVKDSLPGTDTAFHSIRDTGTLRQRIQLLTTGELRVSQGVVIATTIAQLSVNTTYNVWMRFTKGTGANSIGSVAFSTSTTEPTSGNYFASFSDGAVTSQVNSLVVQAVYQMTCYFDDIIADETTITPP